MTYSENTKKELGLLYVVMSDIRKGIYDGTEGIDTSDAVHQLGKLQNSMTADQKAPTGDPR